MGPAWLRLAVRVWHNTLDKVKDEEAKEEEEEEEAEEEGSIPDTNLTALISQVGNSICPRHRHGKSNFMLKEALQARHKAQAHCRRRHVVTVSHGSFAFPVGQAALQCFEHWKKTSGQPMSLNFSLHASIQGSKNESVFMPSAGNKW